MRNRIPLVILAALLILALPATLPAQPAAEPGHDCANCSNPGPETPGRMSRKTGFGLRGLELTEAQRGEFAELRAEQVKATASVRDELKLKETELTELWLTDRPDEKKIVATVRQVSEERTAYEFDKAGQGKR